MTENQSTILDRIKFVYTTPDTEMTVTFSVYHTIPDDKQKEVAAGIKKYMVTYEGWTPQDICNFIMEQDPTYLALTSVQERALAARLDSLTAKPRKNEKAECDAKQVKTKPIPPRSQTIKEGGF